MSNDTEKRESIFRPITVGALYPGSDRGLSAGILSARAMGGAAYPVCTSLIVAGRGKITDVLDVPTDNVSAQLEHLFKMESPNAAILGVLGNQHTIETVFRLLERNLSGPVLLNITLSGPSGEDLAGHGSREALLTRLGYPEVISIGRQDAELLAGMEITSLDDAQVAVQRLHRLGARRVLLRCGTLRARFYEDNGNGQPADFWNDLFYDGEDFGLFEAPYLEAEGVHGSAEAFAMAYLHELWAGKTHIEALQFAKSYITEALRQRSQEMPIDAPEYFWIKGEPRQ